MTPIKTTILSFGMSGKLFHAPFIKVHPGFELVGCWERSKHIIQDFYPGVKSYPSLAALLTDDTVELVVVNTPTSTHYDYAKQSLLAGKHIIVEKAFTTTVAEAVELKDLAAEKNLKISVFQNRRWDSDFKTIKKILAEKLLGDLVEAEIHFDRFKTALNLKQHKETVSAGAGLLKDLGPHIIDQALNMFGFPEAVFGDVRITREGSVVDDWFEIYLYYPTMRMRLKSSLLVREALPGYIFHGSKGSFIKGRTDVQEIDLLAGKLPNSPGWGTEPSSERGLLHTEINGKVIRKKIKSLQGNYLGYYDGIYKAIRENSPMPVTAAEGIQVMQIIEMALESSRLRRAVTL